MNGIVKILHLKKLAHIGFEIGLLIKGISSLLEIFGGFLFLYFNPTRFSNFIVKVTRDELWLYSRFR